MQDPPYAPSMLPESSAPVQERHSASGVDGLPTPRKIREYLIPPLIA